MQTYAKTPLTVRFVGGNSGVWAITGIAAVEGDSLQSAKRLTVLETSEKMVPSDAAWVLTGFTSNARYTTLTESRELATRQAALGRPEASCAALIAIRKNDAWWTMAQDERREIFEEISKHIQIGEEYLPQIARRLHHCRDLGEPFDFVTWFEYAPENSKLFDQMVERLRSTKEWEYVDREVDIRLTRG